MRYYTSEGIYGTFDVNSRTVWKCQGSRPTRVRGIFSKTRDRKGGKLDDLYRAALLVGSALCATLNGAVNSFVAGRFLLRRTVGQPDPLRKSIGFRVDVKNDVTTSRFVVSDITCLTYVE